jgi:hypothetical protein
VGCVQGPSCALKRRALVCDLCAGGAFRARALFLSLSLSLSLHIFLLVGQWLAKLGSEADDLQARIFDRSLSTIEITLGRVGAEWSAEIGVGRPSSRPACAFSLPATAPTRPPPPSVCVCVCVCFLSSWGLADASACPALLHARGTHQPQELAQQLNGSLDPRSLCVTLEHLSLTNPSGVSDGQQQQQQLQQISLEGSESP